MRCHLLVTHRSQVGDGKRTRQRSHSWHHHLPQCPSPASTWKYKYRTFLARHLACAFCVCSFLGAVTCNVATLRTRRSRQKGCVQFPRRLFKGWQLPLSLCVFSPSWAHFQKWRGSQFQTCRITTSGKGALQDARSPGVPMTTHLASQGLFLRGLPWGRGMILLSLYMLGSLWKALELYYPYCRYFH